MPSNMSFYSERETRRPRWKFWRSKSGDVSHSAPATKQSSSCSDDSYTERLPKRSDDQNLENATLPGHLVTTSNSSDASSELKESAASPSLHPRSPSNSSIAPLEHTKSTSTSTSSPVVTREMHTDPVTGDLIITMTTTIVTTTTTKRIIKIPPATTDEVDLDEERRLAAEYLASNGMQSPTGWLPGLQPAPRRSESHSNLGSRSAEQSPFGPRPHTSDRSYSMGSRTGPPTSFHNHARNFSRPGPKQACEEWRTRLSLDARRGMKRAEAMRSKSLILRKPDPKPPGTSQPLPLDADPQQEYSHSIDTIGFQNSQARPHTRDGAERWTGSQRQPIFHNPRVPQLASPRPKEADPSHRRGSSATFGGEEQMKHQGCQQATNNFTLGMPSTGGPLDDMF